MGRRQGRSDPIAKDLSLLSPEVLGTPPAPLPAAKRGGKKKPPPAHRPFSRHGRRDFPASWHLQQRLMHFGRGLVEGTDVVPPPVTAGSPKAALRPTLPLLPQGSVEAPAGGRRACGPGRRPPAWGGGNRQRPRERRAERERGEGVLRPS